MLFKLEVVCHSVTSVETPRLIIFIHVCTSTWFYIIFLSVIKRRMVIIIFPIFFPGSNHCICWLLCSIHIRTVSWRYSRGNSHVAYLWSSFCQRKFNDIKNTSEILCMGILFLIQWYSSMNDANVMYNVWQLIRNRYPSNEKRLFDDVLGNLWSYFVCMFEDEWNSIVILAATVSHIFERAYWLANMCISFYSNICPSSSRAWTHCHSPYYFMYYW